MENVLININNLFIKNSQKQVFSNFDLQLKEKQILGIFGATGCGKTTLLNYLAGIYDEEEIVVDVKKDGFIEEHFVYVFQTPLLLENKTTLKNITIPLKLKSKTDKIEIAEYWLKKLDLEKYSDTIVNKLSGGEKQRLCVARAMAVKPKLILLDEPFSAQDEEHSILIQNILKEFTETNNCGIIIVSHELEKLNKLCDNIITSENFLN